MPNREFLQDYSLYRKYRTKVADTVDEIEKPSVRAQCPSCGSIETFNMSNDYFEHMIYKNQPSAGKVVDCAYTCASCHSQSRRYFIKISETLDWVMKVGQYPAWEAKGNKEIEGLLTNHSDYLKKGLACESHSYGIGAFAYYRRIIEEIIDHLLVQIEDLMAGSELEKYKEALGKIANTHVAAEKIELVKDLLPAGLRPNGYNPLALLHSTLSQGLHSDSEDSCLESAAVTRQTLEYLATNIAIAKNAKMTFTASMKKILDKKSGNPSV